MVIVALERESMTNLVTSPKTEIVMQISFQITLFFNYSIADTFLSQIHIHLLPYLLLPNLLIKILYAETV